MRRALSTHDERTSQLLRRGYGEAIELVRHRTGTGIELVPYEDTYLQFELELVLRQDKHGNGSEFTLNRRRREELPGSHVDVDLVLGEYSEVLLTLKPGDISQTVASRDVSRLNLHFASSHHNLESIDILRRWIDLSHFDRHSYNILSSFVGSLGNLEHHIKPDHPKAVGSHILALQFAVKGLVRLKCVHFDGQLAYGS